jgi:hypothetical protein
MTLDKYVAFVSPYISKIEDDRFKNAEPFFTLASELLMSQLNLSLYAMEISEGLDGFLRISLKVSSGIGQRGDDLG